MALQLNLANTQFGISAPQSYAHITNYYGNKDNLEVRVQIYYNQLARESNMQVLAENCHNISISEIAGKGDLLPAIYEVLKTMSQYQVATDV